jgi:hypothetical protein
MGRMERLARDLKLNCSTVLSRIKGKDETLIRQEEVHKQKSFGAKSYSL